MLTGVKEAAEQFTATYPACWLAHDKVIIIDPDLDSAVVITGSFNFTKRAEERNGENLVVIRDKKIAAKYLDNWNKHAGITLPLSIPTGKSNQ